MTCQSEVGTLRRVLVRHPRDAFQSQVVIDCQWREFGFTEPPDLDRAASEFERFETVLQRFRVRVEHLPGGPDLGLDSLYTRDASVICNRGAILCRMGKLLRRPETKAHETFFQSLGIPILGGITGAGLLEGGDVVWLDRETLAVGCGYRSNLEGIRQLRRLLGDDARKLIVVPLPHWRGPADVFHLMSIISLIDRDLALVYSPLMPVPFRNDLLSRSIELVEVPDDEFETLGGNVLAVAPRTCLMLDGHPRTRARLRAAGAEVHVFSGREICLKGQGGPTCLARPLFRADD